MSPRRWRSTFSSDEGRELRSVLVFLGLLIVVVVGMMLLAQAIGGVVGTAIGLVTIGALVVYGFQGLVRFRLDEDEPAD